MLLFAILASMAVYTQAIVCFPGICDNLEKRPPLECNGGIIPKGGFCQCFDVCAKMEGELCESHPIRGRSSLGTCDVGLTCVHEEDMMIGAGKCVKVKSNGSGKRQVRATERTLCQQRHIQSLISMIVYRGQWTPRCDAEGLFMLEQCDNTHTCFCVDPHTGVVDETTKVQGSANCSPPTTTVATPTLCEQKRSASMLSMVVYEGQWFPKCDENGAFMPEQCDNTGSCFCVDVITGVVDESTKVKGAANCLPDTIG